VDTARIYQERQAKTNKKKNPAKLQQGGVFRKNVFSITGKPFSGPLKNYRNIAGETLGIFALKTSFSGLEKKREPLFSGSRH